MSMADGKRILRETAMKDPGDKAMLIRILGLGAVFILLLWSLLAPPPASSQAGPLLASDLLLQRDTPELSFRWSLPAEAGLEPALVRAMRDEAEQGFESQQAEAQSARADADREGFPFRGNVWRQRWTTEAETPLLLTLSSQTYAYAGGAHGGIFHAGTIFNRKSQMRISFRSLFRNYEAAYAALEPGWCAALESAQRMRRGGETVEGFTACPLLAEQTIVPTGDAPIRAFRVLVAPYVAGPWSEGSYEIVLDASPAYPFLDPQVAPAFAKP